MILPVLRGRDGGTCWCSSAYCLRLKAAAKAGLLLERPSIPDLIIVFGLSEASGKLAVDILDLPFSACTAHCAMHRGWPSHCRLRAAVRLKQRPDAPTSA
mmetsp:Transcript_65261/g.120166  ORF Transcript_65261/g.120166 Transcript_65261/m.120166 type:complete len:100 (+) Transcript_65261:811-1110(+)